MSGQLRSIVALQHALTELDDAQARLAGIPDWMQELHAEHQEKSEEIAGKAAAAEEARRHRREAEGALADAQEKLAHFQGQISRVSTQREYGALLKEIDTVKEQIAEHERVILEAIDVFDEAQKEHDALQEGFRELDERYQAELEKWEAEKPAVAAAVSDLEARIAALRAEIAKPQLHLFERLYERGGGQALAPLELIRTLGNRSANREWRCGACNYQVRPQVVVQIRNEGSVVQCDCGKKILYLDETSETAG